MLFVRDRLRVYRKRVWNGIKRALAEDHTPHEIAASFALGTFVAVLPTGGTALVVFVIAAYFFERVSKLGLLASVIVFNPVVKWSIYGASVGLGAWLLGPVPGVTLSNPTSVDLFTAAPDLVLRHLLGNLIFAVSLAAVGYMLSLYLIRAYVRRERESLEQCA